MSGLRDRGSADTSVSHSTQLEAAIPPSKISALSSDEFVGMVPDDPTAKIELKAFHCQVLNDHEALKNEQDKYKEIPVVRKLDKRDSSKKLPADKTGCAGYY